MKTKTFIQKLIVCFLAGFVCGAAFLRIGNKFLTAFLPLQVVIVVAILILVISIVFAFFWHWKDRQNKINSIKTMAFWIGVMRYSIALDLSMFGFQKLFHLQFLTPLGMLDEPFSSFSGEWLTWSYFGHSYLFACVIGSLQIIGSCLLVFNRTRVLGLIVIMPILMNIVFIDFFYGLAPGVLLHALSMLISAIYLLFLDYERLVIFFLQYVSDETSSVNNKILKNSIRFSILFIPLLLIATSKSPNEHPQLKGKYTVVDMKVNGKEMMATNCADSLLTVVYFDLDNESVFEFNHLKRRMFGKYDLDDTQERISIDWHYPPSAKEKFIGSLKQIENKVELNGKIGKDSLHIQLLKLRE